MDLRRSLGDQTGVVDIHNLRVKFTDPVSTAILKSKRLIAVRTAYRRTLPGGRVLGQSLRSQQPALP